MDFLVKYSIRDDAREAIRDIREQFSGNAVRQLLFFASSRFDPGLVAREFKAAFPGAVTFGCTSYEEYCCGGLHDGSIVAMAFGPDAFDEFAVALAENIGDDPAAFQDALDRLGKDLGRDLAALDYRSWFGLTLFDGFPVKDIDNIIADSGNLIDIVFVGGCASDAFTFTDMAVCLDGESHTRAAVLAVIKPKGKFALLKTQNVKPVAGNFDVVCSAGDRNVVETLDGRPAVETYAAAIGMTPGDLTPTILAEYPLGVMAAGEPFLRSIDSLPPDGGIRLIYPLPRGVPATIFSTIDIIASIGRELAEKREEIGPFKAAINFDCAVRSIVLKARGEVEKFSALLGGTEMIGFSTFGEAYIGFASQTSVMVLFA